MLSSVFQIAAFSRLRAIWLLSNEAASLIDERERTAHVAAMWRRISRIGIHTV